MKNLLKTLATLQVLRKVFTDSTLPDFVRLLDRGALAILCQSDTNLPDEAETDQDDPLFRSLCRDCVSRQGPERSEVCARATRYWLQRIRPVPRTKTPTDAALTFSKNPVLAGLNSIQRLNTLRRETNDS